MSETKFTKGDWWVNHTGPHWNNPDIANYEICWSVDGECVVDHVYELSDAHLIASAPDLYAMLDTIQDYIRAGYDINESVALQIDELLSKARGES